jgi:hypothetical protein
MIAAPHATAQRSPLQVPTEEADAEEGSPELDEIERKAKALRSRLEEWRASSSEYQRAAQEAEARTELIDQENKRLQQREAIRVSEVASPAELNAQLVEAEQDLAAARHEAMELDAQAEQRAERRRRIPELLSVAKQRLKDLEEGSPASAADPITANALAELDALRRAVQRAEIEAYQNEVGTYEARGALLSKRRDRATLRIAYYEALRGKLREAKQQLERLEVEPSVSWQS